MTAKKQYKDFPQHCIGSSDIASLTLVGMTADGLTAKFLHFGEDGSYEAYIIGEKDVEIGAHYEKVAAFKLWMSIYDDSCLVARFCGSEINVYRSGNYGCIIQCIGDEAGRSRLVCPERIVYSPVCPERNPACIF